MAAIVAFGCCWCMDEEAALYWFAARSELPARVLGGGILTLNSLNIFDMLVRAKVFVAAYKAAEQSAGWSDTGRELASTDPWIVVALLAVAVPATFFVHGTHARMLLESSLCRMDEADRDVGQRWLLPREEDDEDRLGGGGSIGEGIFAGGGGGRGFPGSQGEPEATSNEEPNENELHGGAAQVGQSSNDSREERRQRLLEMQRTSITGF